ncbi:hypothetical protein PHYBOEH_005089 [Phytophthora boehmeriae]|uniref:Uncharacterized protein n=1 Tax=Phytophthora boehmeriae TaxID=109152 RepID=A0A8T1X475_9STRA|nr:hypothetical protein PHYBOEH_005089 [Phytophthora boehmeriae]
MSANRIVTRQTEELFQASESGDVKAVAELVKDPEADVNWHCKQSYGATPLIAAISNGHREVVQMLLQANAELEALKTPDRNSPLHEAAFRGDPDILDLILKKVLEKPEDEAAELINLQNQNGSIPLHHACYCDTSNLAVAQLLIETGSNVNALDEQGYSPLIVAAKKNQIEVIDFLRKNGADTTLKNSFGENALHFAELRNNTDAIHLLE